jgi:8-amino-7-oxononanoate synthase
VPDLSDLEQLLSVSPMYDAVIDEQRGRDIRIGGHWLTDYASCNYLGFDLEPTIIDSITEQVKRWGTHPSWSRLLGNQRLYTEIEERTTELLAAPDVLALPTITLIHLYAIPALVQRGTVFMESNSHKTLFDGVTRAASLGASSKRFGQGRLDELEEQLAGAATGPRVVCVDGVHSMTGNVPDLPALARLCREYDAILYIDDAHGFGIIGERRDDETSPYGARGNSIVRYCGEEYDNIVLVAGFSKSYSSLLAFAALSPELKRYLKTAAGPYLYSGPSPTASLATVLAGLEFNEKCGDRIRRGLYDKTTKVLSHVRFLGLDVLNVTGTPVIELPLAPGADMAHVAQMLWDRGIYVTLAAYPIIVREQVGFRIQITATHTDDQLTHLNAVLTEMTNAGLLRVGHDGERAD